MRRLAAAWHARVMVDEVVSHAFSHGFHPQHTERLAAYWAEALGGPTAYSDAYGDETSVVRMHSGNGVHEEMDRRAIACFDQALTDAGLADDPRLRQVLHDYFAWATSASMAALPRVRRRRPGWPRHPALVVGRPRSRTVTIELREITDANREAVLALHAGPAEGRFVSSVADSIEEAAETPEGSPWYRAVYLEGEPVGFVMLSWDVTPRPPDIIGPWFLWKLIVDERHQGPGHRSRDRGARRRAHPRRGRDRAVHQPRGRLRVGLTASTSASGSCPRHVRPGG